jgi:hypothetical protein
MAQFGFYMCGFTILKPIGNKNSRPFPQFPQASDGQYIHVAAVDSFHALPNSSLIGHDTVTLHFLGALSKLRKVAISFVMSVSPSVRMEQRSSHLTVFR